MDQRFLEENFVYVSEAKAEELRAHTAGPGDVVVTQRGTLGQVGLIPKEARHPRYVISQSQMKLTVNPALADPAYVYYTFRAPEVIQRFVGLASTSGVPHVNLQTLRDFSIPLPCLETQQRIAAILGAYDDLIEVNRRRVAVLEEMARGLFAEWFVRFRFPGHEHVPIADAPDGPLPEGWRYARIEEAFDLLGGGTPSKAVEAYWHEGTVDWYTPTDLTGSGSLFMDRSELRITEAGLAKSSAKLFPADSIMMTSRATLGVIAICTGPASTNQGFITCIPNKRLPRTYLYQWLRQNVPVFIAHATGATFKEITKGVFKKLKVCVPCHEVVERFEKTARHMHDMVLALERSNRTLVASRDLLLPRLISGQLSVEAAEREMEDAA
jgi:type I restriction enzyme S subunit